MTEIFSSFLIWSWNAALLIGFAWFLLRFNQSSPARIRHHIWLCALVAVVLFPLWSEIGNLLPLRPTGAIEALAPFVNLPQTIISPPVAESGEIVINLSELAKAQTYDWSFYIWVFLSALWIVGASFNCAKIYAESLRLRRFRCDSLLVTLVELECPQISPSEIGAVSIALSPYVSTPMLTGTFRPIILLPADIAEWTTPEERRWIIAHELAHLSRGDNFVVVFQTLLGVIFFFHPFVRYALRQLSVERELACDERVIGSGANPIHYAESLLKAVERSIAPPFVAPAVSFASRKALQKRVDNILNARNFSATRKSWVLLVLSTILIISAMSLLGCTQTLLTSNSEQEIRDFLDEAREAEINGSIDDFDRLTAPEFVRVGADGEVSNKEQTLDFIRQSAKSNVQKVEIQNEQIHIYGNDAVVTGLGIATGEDGAGKKFVVRNFCTFVLVKRNGRWQCASVQQTRVDSNATARISFNMPS
ncbi:MAG: DUF4440 domain-containing protein [Acidobacteriota bacterium]|nr:DUF4440 domain-containing protein [Acidobacteriota bacterium]